MRWSCNNTKVTLFSVTCEIRNQMESPESQNRNAAAQAELLANSYTANWRRLEISAIVVFSLVCLS